MSGNGKIANIGDQIVAFYGEGTGKVIKAHDHHSILSEERGEEMKVLQKSRKVNQQERKSKAADQEQQDIVIKIFVHPRNILCDPRGQQKCGDDGKKGVFVIALLQEVRTAS